MLAVVLPIAVGVLNAPRLRAQPVATVKPPLAFEVASIRRNTSGDPQATLAPQSGGRLTATNVTLALLVRFAYDLPKFQVSGGPRWIDADRFDVIAKAEGDPSVQQQRLMLRQLLVDRFKLRTHTEARMLPIYAC